ncbi:MAG: AEC family transporter [Chthoniobacteraceae bacterium]
MVAGIVLVFDVFTQVLLPILIMFAAGWVLDRRWKLDLATVVKLNINVFVPAFIFYELTTKNVAGRDAWMAIGYTVSVVVVLFVIAGLVGKWRRYSLAQTRSMQIASVFYNSANYGIPLMHLAYPGSETLQVFIVLVQNVGNFTVGIFLVSSAKHRGWRALLPVLRQPSIWAVTTALIMRGVHGPFDPNHTDPAMRWLWTPLSYFHDGLIAMALITLGVQLSKTAARATLPRLGGALALRLIVSPLVGWGIALLFGLHGELLKTMILSTSFPTAVNTALIAHEFSADTEYATGAVFWSTMFSMVTVTALIVVLKVV